MGRLDTPHPRGPPEGSGTPVTVTDRVELAMPAALAMVTAVRTGPDEVGRILDTADLPALAVALAALVPDDRTVNSLLRWYHPHPTGALVWKPASTPVRAPRKRPERALKVLQPCGTHAAHARHKARHETPCDACTVAERAYQNARPRDRTQQRRKAS